MIPRYSRPEMVAVWSPETRFRIWFEIEAYACEAMAEIGVIPKTAAQAIWEKGSRAEVRHRAHRRDRAGHQARRHRLSHPPRRVHRRGRALRPSGHDEFGRARHLPRGAASARLRHPDRRRRRAARRDQAPRLRAQADADHRPLARHPRRAHDLRAQARAGLRGIFARPRAARRPRAKRFRPARFRARSAPSPTSIRGSRSMWRRSSG